MFCEKCGHPNSNTARFCGNCGAPLGVPTQSYAPDTAPTAQPYAPDTAPPAQPYAPDTAPTAQPYAPNGYASPQPGGKQPMSSATKKIIIISSIGAAVLAVLLVLLFAVIIPAVKNARAVDIGRYYTIEFKTDDGKAVTDGVIEGEFVWNYDAFTADTKLEAATAHKLLSLAAHTVKIDRFKDNGDSLTFSSFNHMHAADTIKVTFRWPTKPDGITATKLDAIAQLEKESGVTLKRDAVTHDYKLADALKAQSIAVKTPPVATTAPKTTAPATTAPATTAPATTAPATAAPKTTAPATTAPPQTTAPAKKTGFDVEMTQAYSAGLRALLSEKLPSDDTRAEDGDKIEIGGIYYVTNEDYRRLVYIAHNVTKGYYIAVQIAPEYLSADGSKVIYNSTYYSLSDSATTAEEAAKGNSLLSSTTGRYTVTEIK